MEYEIFDRMIDVLEGVAADKAKREAFNFTTWFDLDPAVDYGEHPAEQVEKATEMLEDGSDTLLIPHNCGGTACAIGYIGLDPWFREQGFRTTMDGDVKFEPTSSFRSSGFYAVANLLRISKQEAEHMFSPAGFFPDVRTLEEQSALASAVTVQDVIDRMNQFKQEKIQAESGLE